MVWIREGGYPHTAHRFLAGLIGGFAAATSYAHCPLGTCPRACVVAMVTPQGSTIQDSSEGDIVLSDANKWSWKTKYCWNMLWHVFYSIFKTSPSQVVDKQTDTQTNIHTRKHANKQTNKQTMNGSKYDQPLQAGPENGDRFSEVENWGLRVISRESEKWGQESEVKRVRSRKWGQEVMFLIKEKEHNQEYQQK